MFIQGYWCPGSKLNFSEWGWRPFFILASEKIAGIFGRDMEAKFLIKGPKKSNQASNLTSQRMVTESRFMTQLYISSISTVPVFRRARLHTLTVVQNLARSNQLNPRTPRGVDATPLAFFPCNFFMIPIAKIASAYLLLGMRDTF